MPDPRLRRMAALLQALTTARLDGLLLSSLPNIRYLTGFSGTNALLLVTARDTMLVTDFRYDTQVRNEVGQLARIVIEPQSLWTGLWRLLPQASGVEVLGFESAHLVHRDFARLLDSGSRWQWRPTVDIVEGLRERKDPEEVALIVSAARTAERALDETLRSVRVGMTELEVAGILEQRLRAEGSEGFPFPTIVASGERAALPHARSSTRALEQGDLLLIDFGAVVGGYCADITRTFVIGRADGEQRRMYDIVRQANERACAAIRAGMTGRDADAVARSYIEGQGEGEAFGHGLGHGIGLEVHEAPRLARTAEGALPSGAVVTVEPGVYRAGWGGIRIEDDVVLTEEGVTVLTSFTHELLEIG